MDGWYGSWVCGGVAVSALPGPVEEDFTQLVETGGIARGLVDRKIVL